MEVLPYLDSVLISLSLFLMLGYHANLWHSFKTKPLHTSIGIDALRRKFWFQGIKEVSPSIEGNILILIWRIIIIIIIIILANEFSRMHV